MQAKDKQQEEKKEKANGDGAWVGSPCKDDNKKSNLII